MIAAIGAYESFRRTDSVVAVFVIVIVVFLLLLSSRKRKAGSAGKKDKEKQVVGSRTPVICSAAAGCSRGLRSADSRRPRPG